MTVPVSAISHLSESFISLLQVLEVSVLLKESIGGRTEPLELLLIEVDSAEACCRLHPVGVSVTASVQDARVLDLCTHGPGIRECLMARWQDGGLHSVIIEINLAKQ